MEWRLINEAAAKYYQTKRYKLRISPSQVGNWEVIVAIRAISLPPFLCPSM